jgi:CRISPR-associated protein Csh2
MSDIIETRSEILFLYDIADANPNGDPNDENRPRIDRESGRVKVTDVRLKRTIRDYLYETRTSGEDIFCRQIEKEDGTIQEGKDRAEDFAPQAASAAVTPVAKGEKTAKAPKRSPLLDKRDHIQNKVLADCIDVRLFGATIPVGRLNKDDAKGSSVTLTGAVQFAMGSSLHRAEARFIKGTGAFAGGQGRERKTFREEYILPYGLIGFYGIVNQQAAKTTKLTDADVERLYEAIWFGTKGLITRSKIGQRPLLLLVVEYTKEHANSYIGRLDRFLKLTPPPSSPAEYREEAIRGPEDCLVDFSELQTELKKREKKIKRVRYAFDARLKLNVEKPSESGFLGLPAAAFPDFD